MTKRSSSPPRSGLASPLLAVLLLSLLGCSGSGGSDGAVGGGDVDLIEVSFGRLVDVFGYVDDGGVQRLELYQTDVVIGTDIEDERPPGSTATDAEILYDFLSANPDNLQPRLLITREIGTPQFDAAFQRLKLRLKKVSSGVFGQDTSTLPFSVVARNAALQLTFSKPVPVDQSFFFEQSPIPGVFDVKNTTAVQVLAIRGDPNDSNPVGDFEQVPARVIVRGDTLILDLVLLGTEGGQFLLKNNASGLPASANQDGANLRIALALQGPLRMPGLRETRPAFVGTNNAGDLSIIRDFRSGNELDSSAEISRGFIRDAEPPRIVGEMLMYVSSVQRVNAATQEVEIYKGGIDHEIDAGDVFRFVDPVTGRTIGAGDVIIEPTQDLGDPSVQYVRVLVRAVDGLDAEDEGGSPIYNPGDDPDRPTDPDELGPWLIQNAPRAALIAEFTYSRRNPESGELYGDDPINFLSFSPGPVANDDGSPSAPNQNISPFAEAIIRFTKPVDLDTLRAFDSFFFATRDVLDDDVIYDEFLEPNSIDPGDFDKDKFRTPHLVVSRIIDTDGSQTAMRLQPTTGFFLNEEMRRVDGDLAFEDKNFRYFMHVLGGDDGVKDLAGNQIDFRSESQVVDFLAIPFSLDTRSDALSRPFYSNNLSVSVVRRFASVDEDEQPSYFLPNEREGVDPGTGLPTDPRPEAYPLQDLFGGVAYLGNGRIQARTTSRVRKVVDNLNQQSPPSQSSDLRYCPDDLGTGQSISPTASVTFGQGIQNPLNPFGSRLQTVWREIDLSLSRVDPQDFNLDVEQMYWAPFQGGAITFDQFDRTSLYLGHSEYRPEPCIDINAATPSMPNSGLKSDFDGNYAHNFTATGAFDLRPLPHPAYLDQVLTIDAAQTLTEPNGINRFLPLPEFQKPYFVWRDETSSLQGADSDIGSDVQAEYYDYSPYIISPWLSGNGRFVTQVVPGFPFDFNFGRHENGRTRILTDTLGSNGTIDPVTGGTAPTIALPLLADFWTYCDDPSLPEGNGFIASGFNGWQIALASQSSPRPNFRSYSGGFSGSSSRPAICVSEGTVGWLGGRGGYTVDGQLTGQGADNSVYWVMADFVKRQTVVTAGFVDLLNPHRMPARQLDQGDPRLGPYLLDGSGQSALPNGVLPRYAWSTEPSLELMPPGTAIVPEFRAASRVDPEPWRFDRKAPALGWSEAPDEVNFPLDPLKACDAGIRKFDQRPQPETGEQRQWWAYYYNRHVTDYTREIGDLRSTAFTSRFTNSRERFDARDVRYFNWRFIMRNSVDSNPPVSPQLDSFAVSYRFERE